MENDGMDLSSLKLLYGLPSEGENEDVWNIFVQILLPLVLIMTFVGVVTILKFKDVANVRELEGMYWKKAYYQVLKRSKGQIIQTLNATTKELQRIRLLNALDKVKTQKRREIKLNRFFSADNVKLNGKQILDGDFKKLCQTARHIFSGYGNRMFRETMYKEVLETSKIRDTREGTIRVHRWRAIPKDNLPARLGIISDDNRAKIHNGIMDQIDALKNEVISLQIGVLHRIFEYLINHPETLDNDLRGLAERLGSTKDKTELRRLASTFYREVVKKRRKELKKQGYAFLKESWTQFEGPN